jgi:hypothetical protein
MLWTPNPKTVAPVPLCPKCGKLRRSWHRENRQRMGVGWLHGVCCCSCECTSVDPMVDTQLQLTVSGADGNSTTSCYFTGNGVTYAIDNDDASGFDGSYVLDYLDIFGGAYRYRALTPEGTYGTTNLYYGEDTTCTAGVDDLSTSYGDQPTACSSSRAYIDVRVTSICRVMSIRFGVAYETTVDGCVSNQFAMAYESAIGGTYFVCDSIPNNWGPSGDSVSILANGATMIVKKFAA